MVWKPRLEGQHDSQVGTGRLKCPEKGSQSHREGRVVTIVVPALPSSRFRLVEVRGKTGSRCSLRNSTETSHEADSASGSNLFSQDQARTTSKQNFLQIRSKP